MRVDRSIPSLDLYRELEVDAGASTDAIEAAYRSLIMRHHPDRAGAAGLARSKRLNLAREWLVDPERRARYDAARSTRRTEPLRAATRPVAATRVPGSSERSTDPPRPPGANRGHPRRTRGLPPLGTALRLGSVSFVAIVTASLVFSWTSSASGGAQAAPPARLGDATSIPTVEPTSAPTREPAATRMPGPTPVPTPGATPGATARASAAPAGRADFRFSGMYAQHVDQALGGTSACSTTRERGRSAPALTGFEIDSEGSSGSRWQLTLADLTVSWSMDIFFEDTADALWWNSGVGAGSVTRTTDGFVFDVVMTDSVKSLHAKGTVTCR